MRELSVIMGVKIPDSVSDFQKKLLIGNLIVTWRALVEDTLHGELNIPLCDTHKFIGDYSIREVTK